MRVRPFFRWVDLWVGAYWDRASRVLYLCPLPMVGLRLEFGGKALPRGEREWLESVLREDARRRRALFEKVIGGMGPKGSA